MRERESALLKTRKDTETYRETAHQMERERDVTRTEMIHATQRREEVRADMERIQGDLEMEKRKKEELMSEMKEYHERLENSSTEHQTLMHELNENTIEVARLRERLDVEGKSANDGKVQLEKTTTRLASLEMEYLHLQQMWMHQLLHLEA